jgi:mannose-6-phosphate isomerase-like protein (cupin superfamily)
MMSPNPGAVPDAMARLLAVAAAREPLGGEAAEGAFTADVSTGGASMYAHRNERLNIDFTVDRLAFPHLQTMDPRLLRIAPGCRNEFHKHAHESLFVVLEGEGRVRIGEHWSPLSKGTVAFVPRWIFHQTQNTSPTDTLVILAITDFGFTSALLGDYDQRTRLAQGGSDSKTD